MPKVTLLRDPWQNYILMFGKRQFRFDGGKSRDVPVAVALACKSKLNAKGKALFMVEELTNVIPATNVTKQNVIESSRPDVTQLRLIEAELCH